MCSHKTNKKKAPKTVTDSNLQRIRVELSNVGHSNCLVGWK